MYLAIIDDQQDNLDAYSAVLKDDFDLCLLKDPQMAFSLFNTKLPDLLLLDVHMPKVNGFKAFDLIKKSFPKIPVIFISGDEEETTICNGLELGAEDFVSKSIKRTELIARIKSKIQNSKSKRKKQTAITYPGFKLDGDQQAVYLDGKDVHLTPIEFKIVFLLARYPNKVFSRELITKTIWPHDSVQSQNIDTHFSNIRKKLKPFSSKIKTIKFRGYILRV